MFDFGALTDQEENELLQIFGDSDWIDTDDPEIRPIELTSDEIKEADIPVDPTLYDDLPSGIEIPEHYHQ